MAKYVAAYIAEGSIRTPSRSRASLHIVDQKLTLAWQRLYCLFRFLKHFEAGDAAQRYVLYSDHTPPAVDGVLIGHELERLGVEVIVCDFLWRSDGAPERPDFFLFDALEQLKRRVQSEDQLILFGPEALVVQDYSGFYRDIERAGALIVEASLGEVSESSLTAYRDEVIAIREALNAPCEAQGMMAVHPHFIGLSGRTLERAFTSLKRLFPKNNLRATRGEYFLSEPGELLAAIMANLDYHHSNLSALTNEVAAMPDELDILDMKQVPIILPGYGREPDLGALFKRILPDSSQPSVLQDPVEHLQKLVRSKKNLPLFARLMSHLRYKSTAKAKRVTHNIVVQTSP